jgi:hypothetical protein
LLDYFAYYIRVTKSHILTIDAPIRIEVPVGQNKIPVTVESNARQKRGRPFGSKDKNPRKKRGLNDRDDQIEEVENKDRVETDKKIQVSECSEKNTEISINYTTSDRSWNRMEITIDDVFAYNIALEVLKDNEDLEPI